MYIPGVETFLEVVRSQNLSKAAEALHLSQTTISQRLKVLEQELGIVLLERGKGIKKIRLTPVGEEFFNLAEQWSFIWREAKLLQSRGPVLSLSIGSVDSINTFILTPIFQALRKHPTPMKLQIHTSHSNELYEDVENRRIDIAFSLRELVHPNVVVTKFFSSPMVVLRIATPTRTSNTSIHPQELDPKHELFLPFGGREYTAWHERWWNPLVPSQVLLDSANLLFSLLQEPEQWAIVPKIVADAASKRGQYILNYLNPSPPRYICYKLTHKTPSRLTQKALEVFEQHFPIVDSLLHE